MSALGIRRNALTRRQAVMTKRTNLWAAMRILREFTAAQVATVCEVENKASVATYIGQLRRAGFVAVSRRGNQGLHEPAVFRVARNTGPKAPALVGKGTAMFDPNTDQEHPFEQQ